jgi:hypothetical protein
VKSSRQKDTIFDRYESKKEAINDKIETNYPKLASYLSSFRDVWSETFPDPDKKMSERMSQRKK